MPDAKSSLKIQPVKVAAGVVQPRHLAVGIQLAKLQHLAQIQGDEQAPHFVRGQEPTQDGRGYQATDGQHYYRPQLRVAQRSIAPVGPDVRFLKDAAGKVWLQFELEEAPPSGMPDGAEPFNVRVDQVMLQWVDGGQSRQRLFDQPTLAAEEEADPARPNFFIRVGAELTAEEVEPLYRALSRADAQAKLLVRLTFGYWLDEPSPTPRPRPRPEIIVRPRQPRILGTAIRRTPVTARVTLSDAAARPRPVHRAPISRVGTFSKVRLADAIVRGRILEDAREREKKPDFKTVTLTRTLPFSFDPALEQNRPIYSAITGDEALGESWTDTDFGPIRRASFPNTVYRLPDEIRLAYNAELGTPHVIPMLYRDEQEETRVRVTLRAVPWHDPAKLVRLRDYLHRTSAGSLAAPQVVVGGYQEAKLKLTSAFPEHIRALFGDDVPVSLEGGFDITLDLSLEFYRFLCELLVGPVGLTGEATVTLETTPAAEEGSPPVQQTRRVPMRLSLDDVASLPVAVQLDAEAVSPRQVQLVNQSRAEMRIDDCVPRLLQYDANSVVPIEVFEATSTAPTFPATLAADATVTVEIEPKDEYKDGLWNAVQVELIGQQLVIAAERILERIHEVAPTGALSWQLTVECPVFVQDPLPEQFRNLYRVEVQILRAGFAPQQVVLGKGEATGKVTMQRTLGDIIGDDAASVGTFTYRVRNIYFDHQGEWGEEKHGEGSSLFVFPNPVEND